MLITIDDTEKAGFFTITLNDLYVAKKSETIKKHLRKDFISSISLVGRNDDKHVEIFDNNNQPIYLLTHILDGSVLYYPIERVNGETIQSIEDLYSKILSLL